LSRLLVDQAATAQDHPVQCHAMQECKTFRLSIQTNESTYPD
jgi:hypothetical protein